jgi:hypothetical protein
VHLHPHPGTSVATSRALQPTRGLPQSPCGSALELPWPPSCTAARVSLSQLSWSLHDWRGPTQLSPCLTRDACRGSSYGDLWPDIDQHGLLNLWPPHPDPRTALPDTCCGREEESVDWRVRNGGKLSMVGREEEIQGVEWLVCRWKRWVASRGGCRNGDMLRPSDATGHTEGSIT